MNCPHCDEEIADQDATICPKCGKLITLSDDIRQNSIHIQPVQTDSLLIATILIIISAALVASIGYLGIYQYNSLIEYYGSSLADEFLGFLIFGILGIISSSFGLIGSIFMFKRTRFIISLIGTIFPFVAVIATYIIIQQFNYGFTDTLIFSQPTILIITIMSVLLLLKSKSHFV